MLAARDRPVHRLERAFDHLAVPGRQPGGLESFQRTLIMVPRRPEQPAAPATLSRHVHLAETRS
jgi:hypothetical protein